MIDSRDAVDDKKNLLDCREDLEDKWAYLAKLRNQLGDYWDGEAKNQCYDRLDNFIARIEELIRRSNWAMDKLDTIVNTYSDADAATARKMGGLF